MDLEKVEAFLALIEHGSFRLAAEARSITQPTLTKQIQALERAIGTPLVVRSRHGAVPTAAGSALLPRAQAAVDSATDFWRYAKRVSTGAAGSLSIGFGLSGYRTVPAVIEQFRTSAPQVHVELEDLSSTQQERQLAAGRLDVGFARQPEHPGLAYEPIWTDQLSVATTDQTVRADGLRRWLNGQSLIRLARDRGPGLTAQIDRLEHAWQLRLPTLTTTRDLLTVIALAQSGIGAAIVPHSAAHLAHTPLRIIPVDDAVATWTYGPMWNRARAAPAARRLIDIALAQAQDKS